MKILIAATSSEADSGASKCLIEVSKELLKRKYEIVVSLPRSGILEDTLKRNDIPYIILHEYHSWYTGPQFKNNKFIFKSFLNKLSILKNIRYIKKNNIDIVHVNALTAYTVGRAGELCHIPVVWHMREFMNEDLGIQFYNKRYSVNVINHASVGIAISNSIRDKWSKIFTLPIITVNDGVPIENFYFNRSKDYTSDIKYILIYGRIVPQKGQDFFFRAIKYYIDHYNNKYIRCLWAGFIENKSYYDSIQKYINDNNMSLICKYLGNIDDVKKILSNVDIVCVCSKQEGFGRVTIESQLAGAIVLGTNSGATSEIIQNGKTGYLYQYNDEEDFACKLDYIMNNMHNAYEVAKNGQEEAIIKYSITSNVDSIENIYNNIVSNRCSKRCK